MEKETGNMRKVATKRAIIYGTVSMGLLAAIFANIPIVMTYFTKGGICTLLPVATVFVFSYVHGAFASNVWTALGINAAMGSEKMPQKEVRVEKRKRTPTPQPRASLNM